MCPEEALNDFISSQVRWLMRFQDHFLESVDAGTTTREEMQPGQWRELFNSWVTETIENK